MSTASATHSYGCGCDLSCSARPALLRGLRSLKQGAKTSLLPQVPSARPVTGTREQPVQAFGVVSHATVTCAFSKPQTLQSSRSPQHYTVNKVIQSGLVWQGRIYHSCYTEWPSVDSHQTLRPGYLTIRRQLYNQQV